MKESGVNDRRGRRIRWAAWAVIVLLPLIKTDFASPQVAPSRRDPDAFLNQQRAVQERLRRELDAEIGDAAKTSVDWGGWYSSYLFGFDDGVESSRTLRRNDLRLWGRVALDEGAHELYVRGLLSYLDFNSGDSYDGNDDDVEGPNLERGYYRFDLAKAIRAYEDRNIDYNLVLQAGRDLIQFGTGLALSTPLDHVLLQGTYQGWELTGLAGKSVGSTPDFDLSRTATRSHRDFFGAQLRYVNFEKHQPFTYLLSQRDRNSERVFRPFQEFDYDSYYFGLGSTGELLHRLRYSAEWVLETGKGYGEGRFLHKNDVRAWALNAELEYLFPGDHRPRVSVEYLFGSGDSDRTLTPTGTLGNRQPDFKDTGYIGFGYQDTGLSFTPRYSNLHLWRVGGSYYPWPGKGRLGRLELGADWYLFHKHHRDGAVSDPTAGESSGYLGWELDCFANWQFAPDLTWTGRFGVFFPGDAFEDRTTRTFALLGMTWSF